MYTLCIGILSGGRGQSGRHSVVVNSFTFVLCLQGVPKSDTLVNYANIMSYKLKDTRYLHCLNNFNIHYY